MLSTSSEQHATHMQLTRQWLEQVVIGLELCPFAAQPLLENRVRIQVCDSTTEWQLLEALHAELDRLDQHPATELETTLLVLPDMLADFADYNQFLDQVDALLDEFSWYGKYQVASFHPQYCFAGVAPEAAENLTNRAPYPIFHLIREDSLAAVLANVERPEDIPAQNILRVNSLRMDEKHRLFPWVFRLSGS